MPYAPTPYLLVETDGPVTVVTINNPDMRNAFIDPVHEGMQEIWGHLAADHSVRAVVLTGAGKAFSAGGDIPGFIRSYEDPNHRRLSLRGARRLMDAMAEFPKPVVAAVNGPAVGLGCSVAVSCDVLVYVRALTGLETGRRARLKTALAADGGSYPSGSLVSRVRRLIAEPRPAHGFGASAVLTLPPLATLFFEFSPGQAGPT